MGIANVRKKIEKMLARQADAERLREVAMFKVLSDLGADSSGVALFYRELLKLAQNSGAVFGKLEAAAALEAAGLGGELEAEKFEEAGFFAHPVRAADLVSEARLRMIASESLRAEMSRLLEARGGVKLLMEFDEVLLGMSGATPDRRLTVGVIEEALSWCDVDDEFTEEFVSRFRAVPAVSSPSAEVDGLYIVEATSHAADFYDALAEEAAHE